MTKFELIKFLEPFSDDIQIVYQDENGEQELNPQYKINKEINSLKKEFNIDFNEGYIEL